MGSDELRTLLENRIEEVCPDDDMKRFFEGKPLRNVVMYHPPFHFYGKYAIQFEQILKLFQELGLDTHEAMCFICKIGVTEAHKQVADIIRKANGL